MLTTYIPRIGDRVWVRPSTIVFAYPKDLVVRATIWSEVDRFNNIKIKSDEGVGWPSMEWTVNAEWNNITNCQSFWPMSAVDLLAETL